jgi:hypothetical protein
MLRQRARSPLRLEELASLERPAGRAGQVAGELEVVVCEPPLLLEEHEHEGAVLAARRLDRDREQRAVAGLARGAAPLLVEAVVVEQARRREYPLPAGTGPQRTGRVVGPLAEELHQQARQRVQTGQVQVVPLGHQHRGAGAAERVARRLGKRVERLLERDRLAQHGGDPVEAALHPGLPRPVGEALGVAQGKRGEVRKGLEQTRLGSSERPLGIACADAEDPLDLARPAHRRDDRAAEALVGRVRHGLGQLGVVVGEDRPATDDRAAGQALVG